MFARIAVSAATYAIDRPYDYRIPEELQLKVQPGVRVFVPFGKGNRVTEGIVLSLSQESSYPDCKEILRPDICIFLDVDTDTGDKRIADNRQQREIYENKEKQQAIRNRFFDVFRLLEDTENIKIVDASRTIPEVSADIIKIYNEIKEK